MIVVAGPRIDPRSLDAPAGVEVRAFVPDLDRHLAACDLALVQGGLTTCMELAAAGTPFLYFPLKNHFEQNFHVAHRLDRYGAGRRLEFATSTPDTIAEAMLAELQAPRRFKPRGGRRRCARRPHAGGVALKPGRHGCHDRRPARTHRLRRARRRPDRRAGARLVRHRRRVAARSSRRGAAGFRCVTTSLLGYGGTAERRTAADPSIAHEAEAVEAVIRTGRRPGASRRPFLRRAGGGGRGAAQAGAAGEPRRCWRRRPWSCCASAARTPSTTAPSAP